MIENGKKVKFDYSLTVNGELVDTSEGKEPLEYTHGQKMIIPGLESKMQGLKVGDEKTIIVAPEDAYGPVDPEAVQEVSKEILKSDIEPQQGMMIKLQDDKGNVLPAMIVEIKEATIVLNFNHPLAGQELSFQIKIVGIE